MLTTSYTQYLGLHKNHLIYSLYQPKEKCTMLLVRFFKCELMVRKSRGRPWTIGCSSTYRLAGSKGALGKRTKKWLTSWQWTFPGLAQSTTLAFLLSTILVSCQRNKGSQTSDPNNRHMLSHSSGGLKSKTKLWTELVPSDGYEGDCSILSSLLPEVSGFPCFMCQKSLLSKGHQSY